MTAANAHMDRGTAHLTTVEELREHIGVLASVEETDAPFISCYLDLGADRHAWREVLQARAGVLRRILKGHDLADLEESLLAIEDWMAEHLLPETRGVAIFVRGRFGGSFMLPLQFAVPLPNWIAVYPTPNIYHLVELKDNYHRYLVLHAMPERACILEVNLGAATIRAWLNEPQLRERVGREWSRPHYQVNQAERGDRFVRGKVAILQQLMRAGGHTHLLLAGDPDAAQRVRAALPPELEKRLVQRVDTDSGGQHADMVLATLASFIEHEEQESRSLARRLIDDLRSDNLAVAGTRDCLDALRHGDVDTLVILKDYQPDPGWLCGACQASGTRTPEDTLCPDCGQHAVRPLDMREALLRLAARAGCPVEVVEHCDPLMALGGVGCLLRSRLGKPATSKVAGG